MITLNFKSFLNEATVYLSDELTKRGYQQTKFSMKQTIYTNGQYTVELKRDAARNGYWLFYKNGTLDALRGTGADQARLLRYIDLTNQGITTMFDD